MKKFIKRALLLLGGFMMMAPSMSAQQDMPLPIDPEVRIGTLPNGLTYYIRHNEKPKGQADFYIAQKVGSVLEEDNQRGLAHFLEHMCFNGTTNFPGNSLRDWLETVGVKFGQNLNAYTSTDQTVYNISNVPVARESVQDSCLLILHDWANDLLLDPEEIDKERGVIHEEWRVNNTGQMRILETALPKMYPGSRYGYRLPIGTIEVIDNFPYQALRDYYETWYRPDQQGIIVVGDIDVDRIENKIKEMFADIEMPADAPERVYFPVPDTEGTIYAIGSDKEQPYGIVEMFFKSEAMPMEMRGNMSYLISKYIVDMASTMLGNRFDEMATKPDAPFAQAGADYDNYLVAKTADAFTIVGVAKDGDVRPVLEAIYREALRAKRGGFTSSEYDRARDEYLSRLEKVYNDRNNLENSRYVNQYVDHFIDGYAIPDIETEYQIMKMVAPSLPVDYVNQVIAGILGDDNRVVLAMMPDKEGLSVPTEAELAEIIAKVNAEDIEVYVDEVKAEPLIPELPAPGKIVSETHNATWDATEMTLSNGAKVIVKPTKFKDDEIIFDAVATGGTAILPDDYNKELRGLEVAMSQTGLGDYTANDLQKYLAGKQATVSCSFEDNTREISGHSTVKDLPTLMELIYMNFTNINFSADEFAALQNMYAGILRNQESNPQMVFSKTVLSSLYENSRKHLITADDVESLSREKIIEIAHKMTANAADYTFVFVGSIDMDAFRQLVEQYIATIPGDAATADRSYVSNPTLQVKKGTGTDSSTSKMETPQSYIMMLSSADIPYTAKNVQLASIAGQVLSNRFLNKIREEMGATYSVWVQGSMRRNPGVNVAIQSSFPLKPEMKEQVLAYIDSELANAQNDIRLDEVAPVIEYMVKTAIENKEKNTPWANAIVGESMNGVDTFNGNVENLQSITVDDVKDFIKQVMAQGNLRFVILDPEAAE